MLKFENGTNFISIHYVVDSWDDRIIYL
jgi:hypothetical protein